MSQETLELRPPRGLSGQLPPAWRRRAAILFSVAVGAAAGAGAVWGWTDHDDGRPTEERPSPGVAATAPVRLVLSGVSSGVSRDRFLTVDAVLLHDRGPSTTTVRRIHRPGTSLSVRVPDLPVTLSANHPYERVLVRLAPRDCALATEWTPSALPLTLSWEDEHGIDQSDVGAEHDAIELSLIRHMSFVCGDAAEQ